ncbi:hypothetical protein GCM10009743_25760 [Kribbella swartbergensis]
MDIRVSDEIVEIQLTHDEARRLCSAIATGYEGLSRAEYYIRSGLSMTTVSEIVQALQVMLDGSGGHLDRPLDAGVEEIENPRRPRIH